MASLNVIQNNEDTDACAECGGNCCKTIPGICHPLDFGETDEDITDSIFRALDSGSYAIDWWDKDDELETTYYIRPATIGNEHVTRDPSWGGQCTFLGDDGCFLPFDERPAYCRELVPNPPHCEIGTSKLDQIKKWTRYQKCILDAEELIEWQNERQGHEDLQA